MYIHLVTTLREGEATEVSMIFGEVLDFVLVTNQHNLSFVRNNLLISEIRYNWRSMQMETRADRAASCISYQTYGYKNILRWTKLYLIVLFLCNNIVKQM